MKNYNEMAESALNRIKEHQIKTKKRNKILLRTLTPAISLCIALAVAFGVWQGGVFDKKINTAEDAIMPGIQDYFDDKNNGMTGTHDAVDGDWSHKQETSNTSSEVAAGGNSNGSTALKEQITNETTIANDKPYTVVDVPIKSEKAVKSKFNVTMDIYISHLIQDNGGGARPVNTITTEVALNEKSIGLQINNNNDEIFIVCSGYWRLEKLVNGKYEEIVVDSQKYEANSSCGPKQECYVFCGLEAYKGLIEKGKYRIISPTLNIAKQNDNNLEDYTYQGEKSFILYKEFEFID